MDPVAAAPVHHVLVLLPLVLFLYWTSLVMSLLSGSLTKCHRFDDTSAIEKVLLLHDVSLSTGPSAHGTPGHPS